MTFAMKRREFLRAMTGSLALPFVPAPLPPLRYVVTWEPLIPLSEISGQVERDIKACMQAWLEAEEERLLYGTGEHQPMGLLDCRSPLKVALDASRVQAGPGSLDRRVS